jgi:ferredoxin
MKVTVDRARCTGLGICEAMAPQVFEVDGNGDLVVLTEVVHGDRLDEVRAAVDGCPTEALRLVNE